MRRQEIQDWFAVTATAFVLAVVGFILSTARALAQLGEGEVGAGTTESPFEMWQGVAAVALPFIIGIWIKAGDAPWVRVLKMAVITTIASVLAMHFQGTLNDQGIDVTLLRIFQTALATAATHEFVYKKINATGTDPDSLTSKVNP